MSSPADRPVLVTGGAGFIGTHLVEALLQRGDRVACVDITAASQGAPNQRPATSERLSRYALDLRNDDLRPVLAALRPSAVFHLAGHARIPESMKNAREDFEANTLLTVNLLEAVRESAPDAKVILASSAAVYGESTGKPFREDDPPKPMAPYGVSKLASEQYLSLYARSHGLPTASLRLFNVYGPGQRRHVVYDFMRRIHDNPGELLIHGDGGQVRDFVYVTNVVDAFVRVADAAPLSGEVYNVGGDEPTAIGELARMICERMDVRPRFVYGGDVPAGVSRRWIADSTPLRALGYTPRIKLDEGLARTVAWFRASSLAAAE